MHLSHEETLEHTYYNINVWLMVTEVKKKWINVLLEGFTISCGGHKVGGVHKNYIITA